MASWGRRNVGSLYRLFSLVYVNVWMCLKTENKHDSLRNLKYARAFTWGHNPDLSLREGAFQLNQAWAVHESLLQLTWTVHEEALQLTNAWACT